MNQLSINEALEFKEKMKQLPIKEKLEFIEKTLADIKLRLLAAPEKLETGIITPDDVKKLVDVYSDINKLLDTLVCRATDAIKPVATQR